MHPHKAASVKGNNAKLEKYTRDYGAADSKMYKPAPVDRLKADGPEEAVGFGAEEGRATPRADRPARKTMAANPLATYKKGGRVRKRQDGGALLARDQALMGQMEEDAGLQALAGQEQAREAQLRAALERQQGRDLNQLLGRTVGANPTDAELRAMRGRALGGRLEGEMGTPRGLPGRSGKRGNKASTNINIIVAPPSGGGQPPAPGPVMPPIGMTEAGPGAGGPPPGMLPMGGAPGGPGGIPGGGPGLPPGALPPGLPQLPRKRGGRVNPFNKKQHPDEAEDQALVKDMVKPSALKRAAGGALTAGADSGVGRIEKSAIRARRQAGDKRAQV